MGAVTVSDSTEIAFPVPGGLDIVVLRFVVLLPEPKKWLCSAQARGHGTLSNKATCMAGTMMR